MNQFGLGSCPDMSSLLIRFFETARI